MGNAASGGWRIELVVGWATLSKKPSWVAFPFGF